jgi:hypothetical protein
LVEPVAGATGTIAYPLIPPAGFATGVTVTLYEAPGARGVVGAVAVVPAVITPPE